MWKPQGALSSCLGGYSKRVGTLELLVHPGGVKSLTILLWAVSTRKLRVQSTFATAKEASRLPHLPLLPYNKLHALRPSVHCLSKILNDGRDMVGEPLWSLLVWSLLPHSGEDLRWIREPSVSDGRFSRVLGQRESIKIHCLNIEVKAQRETSRAAQSIPASSLCSRLFSPLTVGEKHIQGSDLLKVSFTEQIFSDRCPREAGQSACCVRSIQQTCGSGPRPQGAQGSQDRKRVNRWLGCSESWKELPRRHAGGSPTPLGMLRRSSGEERAEQPESAGVRFHCCAGHASPSAGGIPGPAAHCFLGAEEPQAIPGKQNAASTFTLFWCHWLKGLETVSVGFFYFISSDQNAAPMTRRLARSLFTGTHDSQFSSTETQFSVNLSGQDHPSSPSS